MKSIQEIGLIELINNRKLMINETSQAKLHHSILTRNYVDWLYLFHSANSLRQYILGGNEINQSTNGVRMNYYLFG